MNDRVDPIDGLREYFQELARVAPADHQLVETVARTAVVAQRPAWRVRVPGLGSRETLGRRFPLRYGLVAVTTFLLAWSVGSLGGAGRSPFEGHWTSRDVSDGSTQLLDVAGGSAPTVRFEDLRASACSDRGDDSVDFVAWGTGIVSGNHLVVDYPNGGGCHRWRVPAYEYSVVFDPTAGTLRDSEGTVWHRMR